jgi:hypothetical protein
MADVAFAGLEFSFAPPAEIESINRRHNVVSKAGIRDRNDTVQAWRWAGKVYYLKARGSRPRALPPCIVQVVIPVKSVAQRRDPHNYTPTVVKPLVDGIKDGGAWPDDTAEWVTVADPIFEVARLVRVLLTPRPLDD